MILCVMELSNTMMFITKIDAEAKLLVFKVYGIKMPIAHPLNLEDNSWVDS